VAVNERGVIIVEDYSFDPTITLHELRQLKESRAWQAYMKALDKLIEERKEEAVEHVVDQAIDASNLVRTVSIAAGGVQAFTTAKNIIDTRIFAMEYQEKQKGEQHGTR